MKTLKRTNIYIIDENKDIEQQKTDRQYRKFLRGLQVIKWVELKAFALMKDSEIKLKIYYPNIRIF